MDQCYYDGNCLEVYWAIFKTISPMLVLVVAPIIAALGLRWYTKIAAKRAKKSRDLRNA